MNIEDIDNIDALVRDPRIRQIAKDMLRQYSGVLRPERLAQYCLALLVGQQPGMQEQYITAFRRVLAEGCESEATRMTRYFRQEVARLRALKDPKASFKACWHVLRYFDVAPSNGTTFTRAEYLAWYRQLVFAGAEMETREGKRLFPAVDTPPQSGKILRLRRNVAGDTAVLF